MFGIGNTIGAGIFALTGIAAQYAGPSLFLSFLISGGIAMMTALMYAELSSRIPINGSAFAYTYVTIGELPAFLVRWNMNLRYGATAAGLSRGMVSYFNGFLIKLGWTLPTSMTGVMVGGYDGCSFEAVFFLTILTIIYTLGTKESNIFNMIFTSMKLVTLVAIVLLASTKFDSSNFSPLFLEDEGGFMGTFVGAGIVFYGYLGFDFITTLSEDAVRPA